MELDDLKDIWKKAAEQPVPSGLPLAEIIRRQSSGPVAALKKRFMKQLLILPLVMLMLIYNLSREHDIFSDLIFWVYIAICLVTLAYFYHAYRLVSRLECMNCVVKSNLDRQVSLLEKGFAWRLVFTRIMSLVLILLLEILMYYRQEPALIKWYAQPVWLRIAVYAAAYTAFYFFARFMFNYKYGRHINHLRALVKEME